MKIWEVIEVIVRWLYYAASIGLLASLFLGIKQLKLLQKDMKTRNQRAAFEKTIEYLDWYASDFYNIYEKFLEKFNEAGKNILQNIDDTKKESLLKQININYEGEVEATDTFKTPVLKKYGIRTELMRKYGALDVLNQLEIFSSVMLCGIADEEMAFTPLSDTYCETVREFYTVLCHQRTTNEKLYTNIVGLYKTWQSRIDTKVIKENIDKDFARLSQLPDNKITPLGV